MSTEKQEIVEALEHQRKMIRVLHQRLRQRELQEAQYGLNVPPEISAEIIELSDRIRTREVELARLETAAAEDKIPLAEAEYRVLVSDAWKNGQPEIIDETKLELARLKLGIHPERAKNIEIEIRISLARENFYKISLEFFHMSPSQFQEEYIFSNDPKEAYQYLGRAIRLDVGIAIDLFIKNYQYKPIQEEYAEFFEYFWTLLKRYNNTWESKDDFHVFKDFMSKIQEYITS